MNLCARSTTCCFLLRCGCAASPVFQLRNLNKKMAVSTSLGKVTFRICLGKPSSGAPLFPLCKSGDGNQAVRFLPVTGDDQDRVQVALGPGNLCLSGIDMASKSLFGLNLQNCDSSNPKNLFTFSGGMLKSNQPYTTYVATKTGISRVTRFSTVCLDDFGANFTYAAGALLVSCDPNSTNQLFEQDPPNPNPPSSSPPSPPPSPASVLMPSIPMASRLSLRQ